MTLLLLKELRYDRWTPFPIIATSTADVPKGPPGNGPPLWKEAEATFDGSDLQESDPSSPTQRSDLENSMISQQTAATELSQPPPSVADSVSRHHGFPRPFVDVKQQAELLRLRLRIAMFKVKTGQACIPLSRVEVAHSSRKCASQSLLPPPPLKPTTFSARVVPNPQALSSPPRSASASPELGLTHEGFKTPALPRPKARVSEAVLSSPPDSLGGKEMTDQMEKENIPSSVIKKDAAQCLLGLSQALSSSAS